MNNAYRTLRTNAMEGVGTPVNYIPNSQIEDNTTNGWALGTTGTLTNGIPTGSPTFGSGASGNLSIAAANSAQIYGGYYLSLVSSAATTAGNMLHTDAITINSADQAKVLTFKFYYRATTNPTNANWSGTSSNSFGVACYDVTNSVWLPVAGNFSMTQNSGIGIATGTMQTGSSTNTIRFCIYNANATSGAVTVDFDNVFLGPQTAPIGPVVTDWQSYTPTSSTWGTSNVTHTGSWRRVGSNVECTIKTVCSGAPTNANYAISIPSGLTIDTTKFASTPAQFYTAIPGATASANDSGGGLPLYVAYYSTTEINISAINAASTYASGSQLSTTIPFTWGNGDYLTATFSVPIVGWSSNVQMSNDTDTRVVVGAFAKSGTQSITGGASAQVTGFTVSSDTHGAFSSNAYTIPVTGYYQIAGAVRVASATVSCSYSTDNGSTFNSISSFVPIIATGQMITPTPLIAGTVVKFYAFTSGNDTISASDTRFSIQRVSGPSVVAATESVVCTYSLTSNVSPSSNTIIKYDTKQIDSHNFYSTSTGLATIPVSGTYRISSTAQSNSGTFGNYVYKNGTTQIGYVSAAPVNTFNSGSITIPLLAGDTIGIYTNNTATFIGAATGWVNSITIQRIGN